MTEAAIQLFGTRLQRLREQRALMRERECITMSRSATTYLIALVVTTIALAVPLFAHVAIDATVLGRFFALAAAASIAQLFVVSAPRNQTYHTTIVFLLAAVLLIPAALVPLVAVIQHVPEFVIRRQRLRFLVFNTFNHALDMLAASGVAALVLDAHTGPNLRWALAGAAAALTLVALNHVLLATMIATTRGFTLRESGLFSADSIAADVVPAALGIALATFWLWAPWLLPTAIVPLFLVQRALVVTVAQRRVQPAH